MDPLIPALVAVLLAGATDRPPLLAALLADRYGPATAWAGAMLAQVPGHVLAAIAGVLIAQKLAPEPRALLLALALLSAGGASLFAPRIRDRLDRWRLPAILTAAIGIAIAAAGDRSQFLVLALTARTPSPVLAVAGATIATTAITTTATMLGEAGWRRLPFSVFRPVAAALLLMNGAIIGLGALRLL